MSGRARTVVIVTLAALATVAASFWIADRAALDDGPGGTAALERFLELSGAEVRAADRPGEGTFVLLDDRRGPEEVEEILGWVAGGGRLVLADPSSPIALELADDPTGTAGGHFGRVGGAEPSCAVPETAGVRRIALHAFTPVLRLGETEALTCFPGADGPLLAVVAHGEGRVLLLADRSPLTNELLRDEDNALFALRLLDADGGPVVFGPPRPVDATGPALREALPGGVEAAALGLLVAFMVFALGRGRRLGMSPEAEPISPIPADALVAATGSLFRNAGDRGHAAWLLRRDAARRTQRRLGLPPDGDPAEAAAHARALGVRNADDLLVGPPPGDDDELIRLAADLETATSQLEEMDQ